jgi:formate/nitrite transporter FocA (FNT family)
MKKREIVIFCFMSIFAGMAIGVGAITSLLANSLLSGLGGKALGALLFSIGILLIIVFEMNLFTGMVARIPTMGAKNYWKLAVCFLGNALGIGLVALIARFSFLGDTVAAQAQSLVAAKIGASAWGIKSFCSAVLCGFLITFSIRAGQAAAKKNISSTLGSLFPIIVFAFCGFDHSVANMLYLYYFGEFSWRIIGYEALVIAGNLVGGLIFPIFLWCRDRAEQAENRE